MQARAAPHGTAGWASARSRSRRACRAGAAWAARGAAARQPPRPCPSPSLRGARLLRPRGGVAARKRARATADNRPRQPPLAAPCTTRCSAEAAAAVTPIEGPSPARATALAASSLRLQKTNSFGKSLAVFYLFALCCLLRTSFAKRCNLSWRRSRSCEHRGAWRVGSWCVGWADAALSVRLATATRRGAGRRAACARAREETSTFSSRRIDRLGGAAGQRPG